MAAQAGGQPLDETSTALDLPEAVEVVMAERVVPEQLPASEVMTGGNGLLAVGLGMVTEPVLLVRRARFVLRLEAG